MISIEFDLWQWLRNRGQDQAIDRLRRNTASTWSKNWDQDQQIQALHRQNEEMRLFVGGLVQLLLKKGLLTKVELEQIAAVVAAALPAEEPLVVDDAEKPQPQEDPPSEQLQDLSSAVEELQRKTALPDITT